MTVKIEYHRDELVQFLNHKPAYLAIYKTLGLDTQYEAFVPITWGINTLASRKKQENT
jgi:hypothetical protein